MKTGEGIKKIVNYQHLGLIIALAVLLIFAGIFVPAFFSFRSIASMLANNAIYAILSVGIMFVLLTGEIDVSVGSTIAISSICVSWILSAAPGISPVVLIIAGVAAGIICGAFNGFFAETLGIASMIVTLSSMYIFRGLCFVMTGGVWFNPDDFPESFTTLSQAKVLGFNSIVIWAVVIFILAAFFLAYTRPGRRLYAVGSNEESSRISGIDTGSVRLLAFTLCGALAGLSGVLYAAYYASVNSEICSGYEMKAIAICILGGVSISGGRGRIDGVVISTLLMSVLTYLLSMLPGFSIWQNALQGLLILLAVAVNYLNSRLSERRALEAKEALI